MEHLSSVLIKAGLVIVGLSIFLFVLIFYPVLKEEVNYQWKAAKAEKVEEIIPKDTLFGIVIPKIGANAVVVENVDPFDPTVYQYALTKGVAHAAGSAYPGQNGNVFLFSHSSVNFYEAQRYNSVFYLLDKLENGDEITVYFQEKPFIYKVYEKKIVSASDVQYIKGNGTGQTLTLMTCYPAGTSFKRLLVLAVLN
ncbi:MAG: sortase [Candidatus Daviesbacteria bacterium]|nr:sortase [Candidatus Daviesbacteria bacterium]